jgi:hypothetical protein
MRCPTLIQHPPHIILSTLSALLSPSHSGHTYTDRVGLARTHPVRHYYQGERRQCSYRHRTRAFYYVFVRMGKLNRAGWRNCAIGVVEASRAYFFLCFFYYLGSSDWSSTVSGMACPAFGVLYARSAGSLILILTSATTTVIGMCPTYRLYIAPYLCLCCV